jgi:hypothetical protein
VSIWGRESGRIDRVLQRQQLLVVQVLRLVQLARLGIPDLALLIVSRRPDPLAGRATQRGDFGQFALVLDRGRLGIAFPD